MGKAVERGENEHRRTGEHNGATDYAHDLLDGFGGHGTSHLWPTPWYSAASSQMFRLAP
ncbi:hypothetical protein [Amycolatopsis sp. NPDC004169]|uniref:hypothetical protein n=1 Tax=Amycolatopsis sp. NPDC004169 TaxID=3154453 RepID=UPI0033BD8D04